MRRPSRKPDWQKQIARERIGILFALAGKEFPSHPERSHRYAELARRIGKRYNIAFGKGRKRALCKRCVHYLVPGRNARVRTRASQRAVVVECLDCGHIMRYPYRKERARPGPSFK